MKKILIAGDINGNFNPLLKRLKKFDIAFCVGANLVPNEELTDILSGKIEIEKPIYFIENGPLQHALSIKYPNGGELVKNLHYLGNFGVKKIEGFNIGFLSGSENLRKLESRAHKKQLLLDRCNIYTFGEYSPIFENISKSKDFKGVDILLTCEWPEFKSKEEKEVQKYNENIGFLNTLLTPRYHFAAGNDIHIQRPPFIHYHPETLKPLHVCRFISLCKFPPLDKSEKPKGKYLYAFATKPITLLENEKLLERPSDTQENPFLELISRKNKEKESKEEVDNRKDLEAKEVDWNEEEGKVSEEFEKQVNELEESVFIHVSGIH